MQEFVERKSTRLSGYNYNLAGVYFVTICTRDREAWLSQVVKADVRDTSVGEGLAPPEYHVKLKPCGKIVEEQLKALEVRFENITIEDYVIMPDHIHFIVFIHNVTAGETQSPSLNDIVCVFKSMTSRICKQKYNVEKIFQRSYADHIIRDREDYEIRRKYIYENPLRWFYNKEKGIREE